MDYQRQEKGKPQPVEASGSASPRQVSWEEDGLLAELKAIVLQAEVHKGKGPSLLEELQRLLTKYAADPGQKQGNHAADFGKNQGNQQHKEIAPNPTTQSRKELKHSVVKPCHQWWPKLVSQKDFAEALDLGDVPVGGAAVFLESLTNFWGGNSWLTHTRLKPNLL